MLFIQIFLIKVNIYINEFIYYIFYKQNTVGRTSQEHREELILFHTNENVSKSNKIWHPLGRGEPKVIK